MNIYITRHGETVWNVEKKFQGQGDSELTENGVQAAKKLSNIIDDLDINCIFSSPIKRAITTSEIIKGDRNIPILTDDRLIEVSVGDFEGQQVKYIVENYNETLEKIKQYPYKVAYPNGECLADVYDRSRDFMNELIDSKAVNNVLVVTHGVVLKCMTYYLRDNKMPPKWLLNSIHNCGLSKYQVDDASVKEIYFNKIDF